MVNEHVKDLQYAYQEHCNSSDDEFAYRADEDMTFVDWEAYYERDIFTMWERIKGYTSETGAGNYMLNFASYTEFAEFCYAHSSKKMYMYPVGR
jgi:hypothetical protein